MLHAQWIASWPAQTDTAPGADYAWIIYHKRDPSIIKNPQIV